MQKTYLSFTAYKSNTSTVQRLLHNHNNMFTQTILKKIFLHYSTATQKKNYRIFTHDAYIWGIEMHLIKNATWTPRLFAIYRRDPIDWWLGWSWLWKFNINMQSPFFFFCNIISLIRHSERYPIYFFLDWHKCSSWQYYIHFMMVGEGVFHSTTNWSSKPQHHNTNFCLLQLIVWKRCKSSFHISIKFELFVASKTS